MALAQLSVAQRRAIAVAIVLGGIQGGRTLRSWVRAAQREQKRLCADVEKARPKGNKKAAKIAVDELFLRRLGTILTMYVQHPSIRGLHMVRMRAWRCMGPRHALPHDAAPLGPHPGCAPSSLPAAPSCVPSWYSKEAALIGIQGCLLVSRTLLTDYISRVEGHCGRSLISLVRHACGQALHAAREERGSRGGMACSSPA